MKKYIGVIALVVLLVGAGLVSAEGTKHDMMGKGMKDGMMEKGGMGMHGMMMKMMEKSAVATSDGGIVVVSMNKLSKYDKDLNLIKEVELKTPTMDEMHKMCPMMGKGMPEGKKTSAVAEKTAPAKEVDHASHH